MAVPIPVGLCVLLDKVRLCIPATNANHNYEDGQEEWSAFVKAHSLFIEKLAVHFSLLRANEQLIFLHQSISIGKMVGQLVSDAFKKHTFVSYLHVMDPIWSS